MRKDAIKLTDFLSLAKKHTAGKGSLSVILWKDFARDAQRLLFGYTGQRGEDPRTSQFEYIINKGRNYKGYQYCRTQKEVATAFGVGWKCIYEHSQTYPLIKEATKPICGIRNNKTYKRGYDIERILKAYKQTLEQIKRQSF